jgi:hypothetical protein
MSAPTINLEALTPVEHDLLYCERLILLSNVRWNHKCSSENVVRYFGKDVYLPTGEFSYGRERHSSVYIAPNTVVEPTHLSEAVVLTADEAVRLYELGVACHKSYLAESLAETIVQFKKDVKTLAWAEALVADCELEYSRRQWARFYLVTSSDGHIHKSTWCSTCNKGQYATSFALVPYLSGASVADAVADLGCALCSVCFPDAPVESKEQVKISARVALVLAERGVEAFQEARAKAQADAQKRASDRCEGSGTESARGERYGYACTVCGNTQRNAGKVRAHRRPRFYAVKENWQGYNDGWWNGTDWAPSTKKLALSSREEAQAIVEAHGGDRVRSE